MDAAGAAHAADASTVATPASEPAVASAAMRRRAFVALALLALMNAFNYMDRVLLSAVSELVKRDFALTDTQLGLLSGYAFVLVYAVLALPVARWADVGVRRSIVAGAVTVWSAMTAACGLAQQYAHLVAARIGVGVGEAGALPAAYSLLSDYFDARRRAFAIAVFLSAGTLGTTLGFVVGGALGQAYGWRTTFVLVGLPGLLLALAIRLCVAEPPRPPSPLGGRPPLRDSIAILARNRAYCWALAASVLNAFSMFGITQWLPVFFVRSHGLSVGQAGLAMGATFGLGMVIGMLVGGALADRAGRAGPDAPLRLAGGAFVVLTLVHVATLWTAWTPLAFACAFVATLAGATASPPIIAGIQQAVDPHLRATASGVHVFLAGLLGTGLAPFLIGALSDAWVPIVGRESIRYAITASLAFNVVAAWACMHTARAFREHA